MLPLNLPTSGPQIGNVRDMDIEAVRRGMSYVISVASWPSRSLNAFAGLRIGKPNPPPVMLVLLLNVSLYCVCEGVRLSPKLICEVPAELVLTFFAPVLVENAAPRLARSPIGISMLTPSGRAAM